MERTFKMGGIEMKGEIFIRIILNKKKTETHLFLR